MKEIAVNDKMQRGYVYLLSEREGRNFHAGFEPELTPVQMLALGIFEGKYLRDCVAEFPERWFEHAVLAGKEADADCNYFKIKSRLSLPEWRRRGGIAEPDVRGWFQWYCRYYYGRRIAGIDEWQIKRWRAFRRHAAQIRKNCFPGETGCRSRQRQALLQWAYDPFI